ncbi:hypothetical protein [Gordonia paraffinivorans]|nr:hypothetical protein [Gordonia paraffinivorans]
MVGVQAGKLNADSVARSTIGAVTQYSSARLVCSMSASRAGRVAS